MSFQAMTQALKVRGLPATAKFLLVMIANYADENMRAFPSIGRLQSDTGLSRRTVVETLKKLEAQAMIIREARKRPNGSQTADEIFLIFGVPMEKSAPPPSVENLQEGGAENDGGGRQKTTRKVEKSAPPEPITEPVNGTGHSNQRPAPAPSAPKSTTRGTRIPFGWTASKEERKFATDLGFTDDEVRWIEDGFFEYWKAKAGRDATKVDWTMTWKRWVRTEAERRGGRNGPGRGANGSGPGGGGRPAAGGGERQDRIAAMHAGAMAALDRRR